MITHTDQMVPVNGNSNHSTLGIIVMLKTACSTSYSDSDIDDSITHRTNINIDHGGTFVMLLQGIVCVSVSSSG